MAAIVFPVSTVYDVIDYVAARNNVPAHVPSVALPPDLPRPLRDLHMRSDSWVRDRSGSEIWTGWKEFLSIKTF